MEFDKEIVFPLLDMAILNAYLLHKFCGGKMTHKKILRNPSVRFDCPIARGEYHGQWCFSREAKFIWGPNESIRGETFTILTIQREKKTSRVFAK
jgi:hypothetical protein